MAIVTTDSQHYTDIARKIREKTGETDLIKPEKMVVAVEKVYDAGKTAGYEEGETAGYDNGFIAGIANMPTEEIHMGHVYVDSDYVFEYFGCESYDIRKIVVEVTDEDGGFDTGSLCINEWTLYCENCYIPYTYTSATAKDLGPGRHVLELPPDVVRGSFDPCEFAFPHRWIFALKGEAYGNINVYAVASVGNYYDGKKAQYDEFWDVFQQNGRRAVYSVAFGGGGWSDKTFRPKYDIQPTAAFEMFRDFTNGFSYKPFDMKAHLEECGVTIDFSKCTNLQQTFLWAYIGTFGVIDCSSASALHTTFGSSTLETIEKLIVHEGITYTNTFQNANNLKNITIEGTIGKTINFQWSPLSHDSIVSIIYALDNSGIEATATFSYDAVCEAFGDVDNDASSEWLDLVDSRSNWTIALV